MPVRELPTDGLSLEAFFAMQRATGLVDRVLGLALDEDIGAYAQSATGARGFVGDITSEACDLASSRLAARVVSRASEGVLCGLAVVGALVQTKFESVRFEAHLRDGERVSRGTCVATVRGPARDVLLLERTMLNLLGRLSGVASLTAAYVRAAQAGSDAGTRAGQARVCDTRKTTPGLRVLEKYAVRCGGGVSHRMGLHDALLIKDNHLAGVDERELAGFVRSACERARTIAHRSGGSLGFCEVEVDRIEQLAVLLELPAGTVDVVLLDNMQPAQLRACCDMRDARQPALLLEASGGVNLSTIGTIAATGVDRISVGALTHSAVQLDFGLDAIEGEDA
jgi:nicotinate-nucleotide pyrophosphorylase (carboxylating)